MGTYYWVSLSIGDLKQRWVFADIVVDACCINIIKETMQREAILCVINMAKLYHAEDTPEAAYTISLIENEEFNFLEPTNFTEEEKGYLIGCAEIGYWLTEEEEV